MGPRYSEVIKLNSSLYQSVIKGVSCHQLALLLSMFTIIRNISRVNYSLTLKTSVLIVAANVYKLKVMNA